MNAASSTDSDSKPQYNGAQCPTCKAQFRNGEIVCPACMELLVPAYIDPLIGTVIDKKYRLESLSGRGAQARVYKATHESIGRVVAVKIVNAPTDAASRKAVERLRREARALSLINHPNLPRLFDCGELKDGSAYLVLDYTEGESLLSHIEENGFMAADELVAMISQVLDALEHVHAHGLVHRDIKPDNIFILKKPQGRINVKLLDFGVCKFEDPAEAIAGDADMCGSPLYMSPENVNGLLVDRRSDVYSLGATMYHALSGKPPLSETNLVDIVHAHRSVMPSPISFVNQDTQVPLPVEAAVFRALQKLPGNRYQSAAEMKAALLKSLAPDAYTGPLSHLQCSGAELRAMVAFLKSVPAEDVGRILGQDEEITALIRSALLGKIKSAIREIERQQSPSGESLEELSLENTKFGESL